ncbi:PolC-type DNA polymerase III [Pseudomonas sp. 5P_3.1_Bac2]|uniref:3'-5' exonuclease n=1 Tax=Pseudomonas sp. 5P_3.1_Bac2 TaxID=2971617 RepID=UPI0021C710F4|nr:3'-5' exonuclease [Pseudomonas sp. 5P_3.1_Bac2]MCU1717786.1 3'-5' exonuclease [Pseudomonas sp. 5P_3.1_Bac2]
MNGFNWWRPRRVCLSSHDLARREQLPAPAPLTDAPLEQQRLVVLDLETSGLDLKRDQLLSIGAVVIDQGGIQLGQQFECTLLRPAAPANPSTLIHGLAPSQIANGVAPAQALLDFMQFVGSSPLLAFHAGFDQRMLARALLETLDLRLQHRFFDVAELAPMLNPAANIRHGGLDDWIAHFHLQVLQRHHASADALATAELALILFRQARRQQLDSLAALQQRLSQWRQRQQGMSL